MEDKLVLGGKEFSSRFILGSGKYNINLIKAAVEQGGAEIITLALRRANTQEKENILDHITEGVTLLPNTSGARNAEEAVRIARLSRARGCGEFVKVEIMRDTKYLFPDNPCKRGLYRSALYEPGLKCGKRSAKRRRSSRYAFSSSDWKQQGSGNQGHDPGTDRRDRPAYHCRCRYWQAVPGM